MHRGFTTICHQFAILIHPKLCMTPTLITALIASKIAYIQIPYCSGILRYKKVYKVGRTSSFNESTSNAYFRSLPIALFAREKPVESESAKLAMRITRHRSAEFSGTSVSHKLRMLSIKKSNGIMTSDNKIKQNLLQEQAREFTKSRFPAPSALIRGGETALSRDDDK